MTRSLASAAALVLTLVFTACHREAVEGHAAEEAHRPAEGPAAVPLSGVRGVRFVPAPEPRTEGAWFPGEAIGDEGAQEVLTSSVAGIVASVPFSPGRRVGRGTVLVEIDSPELADLIARRLTAEAELDRSEAALAREERLAAGGATSTGDMEAARRDAAVARAAVEAARLGLVSRAVPENERSPRLNVRAPASGSVVRWSVSRGQGVEAGRELGVFQSAAARLVRVELPLPGPDWKLGDPTEVRSSDGSTWKARVAGLPAALTDDTRRLGFRLELVGGPLPLPGRPVEVRVPFAPSVILPQAALQQLEGTWGVFVRSGDDAVFRKVRRGAELGADVMLLEGVSPGEEIATDGAYLLKSLWLKARSGGDDHDH